MNEKNEPAPNNEYGPKDVPPSNIPDAIREHSKRMLLTRLSHRRVSSDGTETVHMAGIGNYEYNLARLRVERFEDEDFMITGLGQAPLGPIMSKRDIEVVLRWLPGFLSQIQRCPQLREEL